MDEVQVTELEPSEEQKWDAFVVGHVHSNLYHTLVWRNLIQDVFGHHPIYLLSKRRGVITGGLPLFHVKVPFIGSKLISLPYDIGSGGALTDDEESAQALICEAISLAKHLQVDFLQLRGKSTIPEREALGLQESSPVLISEMNLSTEQAALAAMSKDHRKGIRKAETRGVTVREASSWEDFQKFFNVYLEVFRDFGTPAYGEKYFHLIFKRLLPIGAVRLLLAEIQGQCVGGLLLFCGGQNLVSKFAVCLPQYVDRRAYVLLYWEAIKVGLGLGFRRLSWGTSSKDQQGLIAFKKGWGSLTQPAFLLSAAIQGSVPNIETYYDSNGLARRLWKKTPRFITRMAGPPLNRWYC